MLIGLLTDFHGYLAAGQWLAPEICCYCFVTQISQMAQIFLRESFLSHRFHRFSQILDLFGFEKKHADFADDADFLWMGK